MTTQLTEEYYSQNSNGHRPKYSLAAYMRHAARFGPAMVYETAQADLESRELVELANRLRQLRPHRVLDSHGRPAADFDFSTFKLTRHARDQLIADLIRAGEFDRWITKQLDVSAGVVKRVREQLPGFEANPPKTQNQGSKTPQRRGGVNANREILATGLCLQCGAPYAQTRGRGRPKKYCSQACRRAAEFELRRASTGDIAYPAVEEAATTNQ